MSHSLSDFAEDQSLENEALSSIFGTDFTPTSPTQWALLLLPCPGEAEEKNHVKVEMNIELPETYPDVVPIITLTLLKGLSLDHLPHLTSLIASTSESELGMPMIFTLATAVQDWLVANNKKGMEDSSMHAQMLRKAEEKVKEKNAASSSSSSSVGGGGGGGFEAQVSRGTISAAEKEEIEVAKRRRDGTPCTKASFALWKTSFDAALALEKEVARMKVEGVVDVIAVVDTSNVYNSDGTRRLTGYEVFINADGAVIGEEEIGRIAETMAAVEDVAGENELDRRVFLEEGEEDVEFSSDDDEDGDYEEGDEEDEDDGEDYEEEADI